MNSSPKSSSRTHRHILALVGFLAVYYIVLYVLQWPLYALVGVYALMLTIVAFVFRAGLYAGLANINYSRGKRAKARAYFEKSFKHNQKKPIVYLNYAIMLVNDGEGEISLEYAKKALEMNPDAETEKNARLTIASCYWVMGEVGSAVSELEFMRDKYERLNDYALTTLGYLYFKQGKLGPARAMTEKALEENPGSGSAWDNMGQIYLKENNTQRAEEAFLKAIELRPGLADSLYYLGAICEERGDLDKAGEYFVRAYHSKINKLNTITMEQASEKYNKYKPYNDSQDSL